MSDKKHIDFDLDFLNRHEKGKCKVKRSRQSEGHDASRSGGVKEDRPSSQKKRIDYEVSGAKSVLAIVVVVALIVVFVISTHSKSDVKSSNTQSKPAYSIMDDDTNYLCSSYHMKKLNKMNVSRKEQANLDKEYGLLEKDMRSLKALETKLSNTPVDNYSQASINRYNKFVNEYNAKLKALEKKGELYDIKANGYNERIRKRNVYMTKHCKKQ